MDRLDTPTGAGRCGSRRPESHCSTGRARNLRGPRGADRIAVIDVETTGLYRVDRVVEIAIVTMDATGSVIDEFDTLINPGRDPGPTWIHGVTASMLTEAPSFDDVAHHLAVRLHGAVVVAHNLRFDTRMIGHELSRAGIDIDWGYGLDTLHATGCKLAVACAEYDIPINNAHRALVDARATGQLLFAVAEAFSTPCSPVSATPLHRTQPRRVLTRDGFTAVTRRSLPRRTRPRSTRRRRRRAVRDPARPCRERSATDERRESRAH